MKRQQVACNAVVAPLSRPGFGRGGGQRGGCALNAVEECALRSVVARGGVWQHGTMVGWRWALDRRVGAGAGVGGSRVVHVRGVEGSLGPVQHRKKQSQRRLRQRGERLACALAPAIGRRVRREEACTGRGLAGAGREWAGAASGCWLGGGLAGWRATAFCVRAAATHTGWAATRRASAGLPLAVLWRGPAVQWAVGVQRWRRALVREKRAGVGKARWGGKSALGVG